MKEHKLNSFEENGILNIEKIINRYNSYIYTILKNSLSNELDIEETLSDVFLIFWKNYKKLDKKISVKPYLIGITKNLVKKKYSKNSFNISNIELFENAIISDINIEELIENNEKSKIISDTLSNIRDVDKNIFIMFYYNQRKIKDIAKLLKISESKVKISLYRSRKTIKKKIKEKINITIVNEDGTEETLEDANIYVTDNNEYVVEYLIKDDSNTQNQTEESFKIYTNTLEEENKTVDAKVSENETNIEIGE